MKNNRALFFLIGLMSAHVSLSAQSVLLTPGGQSINDETSYMNQLTVNGNGLLVQSKTKVAGENPLENVYTLSCLPYPDTVIIYEEHAGILKDPSGDSDYLPGVSYDCINFLYRQDTTSSAILAYKISIEELGLGTNNLDSLLLIDFSTGDTLVYTSSSLLSLTPVITGAPLAVRFVTNGDSDAGSGFRIKWEALIQDGPPSRPTNIKSPKALVFDTKTASFWAGFHSIGQMNRENESVIAIGNSNLLGKKETIAIGSLNQSMGDQSVAIGHSNKADSLNSLSIGYNNEANGAYSYSFGSYNESNGLGSGSLGVDATADGKYSFAQGMYSKANALHSIAMGYFAKSDGNYAISLGNSFAKGLNSRAFGINSESRADRSTTFGFQTISKAPFSIAIGVGNDTLDTPNNTASDRLFQLGNGERSYNGQKSNALTVRFNAQTGINTAEPMAALHIKSIPDGDDDWDRHLRLDYDGSQFGNIVYDFDGMKFRTQASGDGFYFRNAANVTTMYLSEAGDMTISGSNYNTSDRRLKRDFSPLKHSLVGLRKLNGYHYFWKDASKDQTRQTGLIAQEVAEVFPELVNEDKEGYLSVNYVGLIPHLLEAVKELNEQNEALISRIRKLENALKGSYIVRK